MSVEHKPVNLSLCELNFGRADAECNRLQLDCSHPLVLWVGSFPGGQVGAWLLESLGSRGDLEGWLQSDPGASDRLLQRRDHQEGPSPPQTLLRPLTLNPTHVTININSTEGTFF